LINNGDGTFASSSITGLRNLLRNPDAGEKDSSTNLCWRFDGTAGWTSYTAMSVLTASLANKTSSY